MYHMEIRTEIPLHQYTTMWLGGAARFMASATSVNEVRELYNSAKVQGIPIFVLGGGSNVIARDEGFAGAVLLNRIKGFEVLTDDGQTATIKVGAGEIWDDVVKRHPWYSRRRAGAERWCVWPGSR